MADGLQLNAGSGGAVAFTDEITLGAGVAHVQVVKLMGGADGSAERLGGDAANGLDVDVTRLPAGANLIGNVALDGRTSGGPSQHSALQPANTTGVNVKASPGQVFAVSAFNASTSARCLKLYNHSGTPTNGDTPVRRILIPPQGGVDLVRLMGIPFGTGIAYRVTTGLADNDNNAAGANEVFVNIDYK